MRSQEGRRINYNPLRYENVFRWDTRAIFDGTYADTVVEASRLKLETGSSTKVVNYDYSPA